MRSINTNKEAGFRDKSQCRSSAKCRRIRARLYEAMSSRFSVDADWVQNHIAGCPRCQRRLALTGKVNLALSVVKSQPHKLDLLMRANAQAIGVLKHSLRGAPKARKLRTMLPEPKLLERWGKYRCSAANLAACIAIVFLMKIGVFSSMNEFQTRGQKVIRQYYASQVGQDLTEEVFAKDTTRASSGNSGGIVVA